MQTEPGKAVSKDSTVTLEDLSAHETYTLSDAKGLSVDLDWLKDLLPIGPRLLGKHVGDLVGVTPPGRGRYLKIVSIS